MERFINSLKNCDTDVSQNVFDVHEINSAGKRISKTSLQSSQ